MVTILVYDQHVPKFLWRNLEVERELDTYVKPALTFGDGLSHAMAIVALHKTAKLKEEEEPKATQAIIQNTHIDNFCDSVNSVVEVN